MIMIMIICTIMIVNIEYIWLASFYAIQIEVFAAVAYIFNHLIHTVCAPPHRFLDLPHPTTPNEKDSPPPSLVGTFSQKKSAVLLDFVQITSPPSPQFGKLIQFFLNAKNTDLSNIQNDSLSKILLK